MSNVPQLRFKDFNGEWEEKQLSKVCELKAGKFVPASKISEKQESDMFPCYGGNGLRGYTKTKTHEGKYSLIGRQGALCGNIQFASGKFHATEHAVVVSPSEGNDSLWLYYQLYRLNLNKYATGQAQPGLSVNVIERVKTNIPSIPEQGKIASFLTSVDTKINQLTKKEELLQQYKKGLMQKIFSKEIWFRDDDGNEYPEWEEKKLKNVLLDFRLGGNYKNSENISLNPLIKMGNLDRGKMVLNKIEYIDETETVDETDRIQYGDLFFNTRNTLDLVGKVAIWKDEISKAYYNSNLMWMKFENNFFMNYRLNSYNGLKALRRIATGTTSVAAIYTKDLLKVILSIPCPEEQTQIANFLSSMDSKIEQVQKQIDSTKEFKKALLQQMFV